MVKVVEFGYAGRDSVQRLEELMKDENTILCDIRKSPYTSYAPFDGPVLRSVYGSRYLWMGQTLGNKNYNNGGKIELVDPDPGLARLISGLEKGYTPILLCGCKNYDECHRHVVADLLSEVLPEMEIVHPEGSENELIKCLSINQPWAWLISQGYKDIENRDWRTGYRGPVLIHASKKLDGNWFYPHPHRRKGELYEGMAEQCGLKGVMPGHKSLYSTGAIVGIADLVDVVEWSESDWFRGPYGFVFANRRAFEPIPYRGELGLFNVPKSILALQEVIK